MSDQEFDFEAVWKSKEEHRKHLANIPFLDKMVILKRMQERAKAIKNAKFIGPRKE